MACDILQGVALTDARELSGIFSTADGLLAAYRSTAALAATVDPNFDPSAFPESGDTVYICAPGSAQGFHAPLVVALLDQIRVAAYRYHPFPPMLWALDELANIAPLPDLPTVIAEGGSQGVVVMACVQDLSQARARWRSSADGFLTLFTHTMVLPGVADMATLRQISALAGEVDVPTASTGRSDQLGAPTMTTWHPDRRPRLPVDAVAAGRPGEGLLVSLTRVRRVRLFSLR